MLGRALRIYFEAFKNWTKVPQLKQMDGMATTAKSNPAIGTFATRWTPRTGAGYAEMPLRSAGTVRDQSTGVGDLCAERLLSDALGRSEPQRLSQDRRRF